MADDLSARQTDIMKFIEEYIRRNRRPPTNREIGEEFDIHSTGHVDHHLTVLEQRGYIAREAKKSRSIRVLRPLLRPGLPIRGTIAAGQPLGIYEESEQETLDFSPYVSDPPADEYVLLVHGDSMIEDHIADGDYVVIKESPDAQRRRYHRRDAHDRLGRDGRSNPQALLPREGSHPPSASQRHNGADLHQGARMGS